MEKIGQKITIFHSDPIDTFTTQVYQGMNTGIYKTTVIFSRLVHQKPE